MVLDIQTLLMGMLVFIRAMAFLLVVPFLGGEGVPKQFKVALALGIAWMLTPVIPVDPIAPNLTALMLVTIHGFLVGAMMGLVVRFLLGAVESAGRMIAMEMGLAMSSSIDPVSRKQATTVEAFLHQAATILFFTTELHRPVIHAFVRSFAVNPITTLNGPESIEVVVAITARIFVLAVQMGAPIVAINFLINISFAILGKVVPKMNVFMVSFAVRIIAGLMIFGSVLGLLSRYILGHISQGPELMLRAIAW